MNHQISGHYFGSFSFAANITHVLHCSSSVQEASLPLLVHRIPWPLFSNLVSHGILWYWIAFNLWLFCVLTVCQGFYKSLNCAQVQCAIIYHLYLSLVKFLFFLFCNYLPHIFHVSHKRWGVPWLTTSSCLNLGGRSRSVPETHVLVCHPFLVQRSEPRSWQP